MLYQWAVWLHVLSAFLFIFVHGSSMATAFLLSKEKNVDRIKMLLDLPSIGVLPMGISLIGLLVTSIYMGSAANWWSRGWWGASFLLMFALMVWMTWYSRKFYSPIRKELGNLYMTGFATRNLPDETKSINMDEVQRLVAKTNPILLASVGAIVTAVLLFLMRFKPF